MEFQIQVIQHLALMQCFLANPESTWIAALEVSSGHYLVPQCQHSHASWSLLWVLWHPRSVTPDSYCWLLVTFRSLVQPWGKQETPAFGSISNSKTWGTCMDSMAGESSRAGPSRPLSQGATWARHLTFCTLIVLIFNRGIILLHHSSSPAFILRTKWEKRKEAFSKTKWCIQKEH